MQPQTLPLTELHPHPANSNVMPSHLLDKLIKHIDTTGQYPPIIVRKHNNAYQILDGHHRVKALQQLDRANANCTVWEANDEEALLLLATLNRLQGQDDPLKRAHLLRSLAEHHTATELTKLLPERIEQVKKLLSLDAKPPKPTVPPNLDDMPVAVHFFLLPQQKRKLSQCLKQLGGTREQALMKLVEERSR